MLKKIPKIKSDYSTSVQLKRKANDVKLKSQVEKLFTSLITRKRIAFVALGVVDKEYRCKINSRNTVFRVKLSGLTANTHLATDTFCLRSRLR